MEALRFDVFGRELRVTRGPDGWLVHHVGADGKRRPARDIVVPSDLAPEQIGRYLDDLCHEWATARHPRVRRLD